MAEVASYYVPLFGNVDYQIANPDLVAESQQGGEGGVELYFGTRGSIVVTRYNQTVDNLIQGIQVDSVQSLVPDPYGACVWEPSYCGYAYFGQYSYINVGSIRNSGWEYQATANQGPFTARATYTATRSRVLGITPKYRSKLQGQQYARGESFSYLPEHTWALSLGYVRRSTTVSLSLTGVGKVYTGFNDMAFGWSGSNRTRTAMGTRMSYPAFYRYPNPKYSRGDLAASQRLSSNVEAIVQVQNITDQYMTDIKSFDAVLGRQSKAGFRIRL
jgi:outer membrane receptor protein involved in Fe transport